MACACTPDSHTCLVLLLLPTHTADQAAAGMTTVPGFFTSILRHSLIAQKAQESASALLAASDITWQLQCGHTAWCPPGPCSCELPPQGMHGSLCKRCTQ